MILHGTSQVLPFHGIWVTAASIKATYLLIFFLYLNLELCKDFEIMLIYVNTSSLAFVKRVGDDSMHQCTVWCVLIGLWPKKQPLHRAEPRPWWSSIGQVRIGAAAQTPKSLPGFQYCKCKAFMKICRNLRPKLIKTWWVASSWECFAPLNLWKWQIEDSQETIWEQLKNTRAQKKTLLLSAILVF